MADKLTFFNSSDLEPEMMDEGVRRYIYTGENIQIVEYHFPPNVTLPAHKHEMHEQMGQLLKGKMGFRVGGVEKILQPGDFYHAGIGVEHNAWTFDEPSVLIDIFSPPREDLKK